MTTYVQCLLKKAATRQFSWIPKEFALLGKVLSVRDPGADWDTGWTVEEVNEQEISDVPYTPKDIRDHRRATGDAARKREKSEP